MDITNSTTAHPPPPHYHQSGCFFSLSKEETFSLLILGQPRSLLWPQGIHSVTLSVHLLSLPTHHKSCPSVFVFSHVPDNVCHTTLFADPVRTLSAPLTPTIILSIFLWVVTSFSSWVLLSDHVSQPYVIIGSIHSLNASSSVSLARFCLAWCCPAYRMHSISVISLVWLPFQTLISYCPYGIVELILPRNRGFAGCSSTPHQCPGSLALQRVVQVLSCRRLFFIIDEGKTEWDVVLISLQLHLVYYL